LECLDTIPNSVTLPDDLTLTELILNIMDHHFHMVTNLFQLVTMLKKTCPILHQNKQMVEKSPKCAHDVCFI